MEPMIWLAILAVCLVIEALTAGLTTIWFAGGALVAGIAAYLECGVVIQLLLFFVVSLALLIFTRPLAVRFMNKGVEKTNVATIVGKRAIVTEEINDLKGTGKVLIQDIDWLARSRQENVIIPREHVVEVKEIRGVTLIVEECKEGK